MNVTANGLIATANGLVAAALLILGFALLWQVRGRIVDWPVSALVALGGAYLLPGIAWGQLALFRTTSLPDPFSENGIGTLVLRLACVVVVVALARRVIRGHLLNAGDQTRLDGAG